MKWVEHQNAVQGVAPSQRLVWEFRQSLHTYEVLASGSVVPHCAPAAVKWMQRFRQRWQLQMGTQPVQETLPLEVLRAKVPSDEKSSDLFFGHRKTRAKQRGSVLWTPFWVRLYICNRKRVRNMAPFFAVFQKGSRRVAVVPIPDADYSCSYTASPPELGRDKHSLFLPPEKRS